MSILQEIKRRAEQRAREGLEMLGIKVPGQGELNDADAERNLLDICLEKAGFAEAMPISEGVPLSAEAKTELLRATDGLCGSNAMLRQEIRTWAEALRVPPSQNGALSDALKTEALGMIHRSGAAAQPADKLYQTLENVARSQNIHAVNLIHQAALHILDPQTAPDAEKAALNTILRKYRLCIIDIRQYISLCVTEDAAELQKFWNSAL